MNVGLLMFNFVMFAA